MKIIAKNYKLKAINLLNKLFGGLIVTAYADEIDPTDPANTTSDPQPNGTTNFEDLISKARKEERDKLYPQINKLKDDKNKLLLVIADRDTEISQLKEANTGLEKDKTELAKEKEKADPKLTSQNTELNAQITALQTQVEQLKEQHERDIEKERFEVTKMKLIAAAGDDLIPQMITGSTEEEVAASIEASKAAYVAIQEKALQGLSYTTATPSRQTLKTDKSTQDIANMSKDEYAEWRKATGLR